MGISIILLDGYGTLVLRPLMTDLFEFWARIGRGEHVHPADKAIFDRVEPARHGFRLDCLPACFNGPLREAPVVLLFLSPGFSEHNVSVANSDEGKDRYLRRWRGQELIRNSPWIVSRTGRFGEWAAVQSKLAILNIGAYSSSSVRSYASLLALPSSRVSLGWAQDVLFREAEAGKRVVICMRSAQYWGLEQGKKYKGTLFAPRVNRGGHLLKTLENDRLVEAVRERLASA